ncbi:hypothetical protein TNCV_615471 [Trichonephila clavipes]|nr:hypothetical protein TNCV_615471 [Trichonephila clavipes]
MLLLESLVDDLRSGQVNTVITVNLNDKVDDLVRSDRCVPIQMLRGGCQRWNNTDNCSRQVALSEDVCAVVPKQLHDEQIKKNC